MRPSERAAPSPPRRRNARARGRQRSAPFAPASALSTRASPIWPRRPASRPTARRQALRRRPRRPERACAAAPAPPRPARGTSLPRSRAARRETGRSAAGADIARVVRSGGRAPEVHPSARLQRKTTIRVSPARGRLLFSADMRHIGGRRCPPLGASAADRRSVGANERWCGGPRRPPAPSRRRWQRPPLAIVRNSKGEDR